MGKTIISQARGHGGPRYQVRKRAFIHRVRYPIFEGEAKIMSILHSAAHSAPLLKIHAGPHVFFNVAFDGALEGQTILLGKEIKAGNIVPLNQIPAGTAIYNIERNPGDGGKMIRAAGGSALVNNQ